MTEEDEYLEEPEEETEGDAEQSQEREVDDAQQAGEDQHVEEPLRWVDVEDLDLYYEVVKEEEEDGETQNFDEWKTDDDYYDVEEVEQEEEGDQVIEEESQESQRGVEFDIEEEEQPDGPEEREESVMSSCGSFEQPYVSPDKDDEVANGVAFVPLPSTNPTMVLSFRSNQPILRIQLPNSTKFVEYRYAPDSAGWAIADVFTFQQRLFATTCHGRIAEVDFGDGDKVAVRLLETESGVEWDGERKVVHHVFDVETDDSVHVLSVHADSRGGIMKVEEW